MQYVLKLLLQYCALKFSSGRFDVSQLVSFVPRSESLLKYLTFAKAVQTYSEMKKIKGVRPVEDKV